MEEEHIFGVDTTKPVTPLMTRDAMINCFYDAHKNNLDLKSKDESLAKELIISTIKRAFDETEGNFDEPNKHSLLQVMNFLKNFSQLFRDKEVIQEHFNSMMKLMELTVDTTIDDSEIPLIDQ